MVQMAHVKHGRVVHGAWYVWAHGAVSMVHGAWHVACGACVAHGARFGDRCMKLNIMGGVGKE